MVASAGFVILHSLQNKKNRLKRRWWLTSVFRSRETTYNRTNLLNDLRKEDSGHFRNFCGIDPETLNFLLNNITPKIVKTSHGDYCTALRADRNQDTYIYIYICLGTDSVGTVQTLITALALVGNVVWTYFYVNTYIILCAGCRSEVHERPW